MSPFFVSTFNWNREFEVCELQRKVDTWNLMNGVSRDFVDGKNFFTFQIHDLKYFLLNLMNLIFDLVNDSFRKKTKSFMKISFKYSRRNENGFKFSKEFNYIAWIEVFLSDYFPNYSCDCSIKSHEISYLIAIHHHRRRRCIHHHHLLRNRPMHKQHKQGRTQIPATRKHF